LKPNALRGTLSVIVYDHLHTLCIADLKRRGFLQPGLHTVQLNWNRRGRLKLSVRVALNMKADSGVMELLYFYKGGQVVYYETPLEAQPTNLGIGQRWYFTCSRTEKRCTKLYFANGYFQHREGIAGALYQSQTLSHSERALNELLDANEGLCQPYLKRHYRGKPTKRYLAACKQAERLSPAALAYLKKIGVA